MPWAPDRALRLDVLERHLEEAAFLWTQWEAALGDAGYTLAEVAEGPEWRLRAHLDALLVAGRGAVPRLLLPALEEGDPEILSGALAGCAVCFVVPLALAITFFLPAAFLAAVEQQRFGAAFEIGRHWDFIRRNAVNYLLAILIYLIARILGGFGFILLCIGVVFTGFWAFLITTYGFAQAYRVRAR